MVDVWTFGRNNVVRPAVAEVYVRQSESSFALWRRLKREDTLRSTPGAWIWFVMHRPRCLQAGRHTVSAPMTAAELLEALCSPVSGSGVRVTVPEGYNIWQIGERLEEAGVVTASEFVDAATSRDRLAGAGIDAPSAEGLLFPDTWDFAQNIGAETVVGRMAERHKAVWNELLVAHPGALARLEREWDISPYEAVIVASIVEKEAVVADERPRIARVIYNRIARGMRLQCDPTCVYGPELWRERPTRSLCRDPESRYSTYVIDGLPPTPIAAPGRSSLAAVLAPSDEADILYFVTRGDGSRRHEFAATLAEHNENVERWLRNR